MLICGNSGLAALFTGDIDTARNAFCEELRLCREMVILPVALGNGLPLFKDLAKPLRLDLTEARSFPDGTVISVYQPVKPAA